MSKYDDMMELLKFFYDQTCAIGKTSYSARIDNVSGNRMEILDNYRLLKHDGYIEGYCECIGVPIGCRLTAKGIRQIEGIKESDQSKLKINAENVINNGILANSANNNTVNITNGLSYDEIKSIVTKLDASEEEKDRIVKDLAALYECIEKGYPLQRGLLSRLSAHLTKYQVLYAAVAQSVVAYLTTVAK
ncbi:MAG: hypothetical protein GXX11_02100 [Acholeplasmataceae bacterium]|nr:hypothetical protein [Acholeplasmataceae bacterium]